MAPAATLPNLSSDLVWEVVRNQNSFLVKTGHRHNGGLQLSRDPFNLTNKHSRKHAGFVNEKAVGVTPGEKGGLVILSKKPAAASKPAQAVIKTNISGAKSNRKSYKAVANQTAKTNYRPDLRSAAVERVSALRRGQQATKPDPEPKLRGTKAKKAAAAAAGEA